MEPRLEPWIEWQRLCRELGVNEVQCAIGFQQIVVRYGEQTRVYHTLEHIRDCLEQFRLVRDQCECPLAVELAIWFHDLVYDTMRMGNEEASAKSMVTFARASDVDEHIIVVAESCVLATKHNSTALTADVQIMIDIDLSILGRDWETYEAYTRAIRQEYKRVAWLMYVIRRRSVMKRFLDRSYIFSTSFFRLRFEKQARANITRELRSLRLL